MNLNLASFFSGIGAFEKAIDNLGIPYELIGFSEIDKYAVKSYCAIHNVPESLNLGDITKVDANKLPKNIDLLTYGFPCQDISLAGKQKGLFNEDGTQTRSGLFFDALRIIEATQPRVAIAENVKNLTSKKFSEQFKIVLDSLEEAGYNNYWQVLNAKDYGIPQNRERVFIVSIRKDIDTGFFDFTEGFPLELRLKDMLEDEVEGKYYLSDKMKDYLFTTTEKNKAINNGHVYSPSDLNGIAKTIVTKEGQRIENNFIEESSVLIREATKNGYAEAYEGDSINLEQPNSKTRRGRVGHGVAQTLTTSPQQAVVQKVGNIYPSGGQNGNVYSTDGISPTILSGVTETKGNGGIGSSNAPKITDESLKIRKLTPKECFRLMGFDDDDFAKAEAVNSNTQLYKQAGNSIVVPVVEYIIKALFDCGALEKEKEKNMELKVKTPTFPEVIEFNFEELKQEITERASAYANLVYTDDQIADAKKDRATLNKFVKVLSDERIKVKKECMKPYEDFEAKIKELDSIVGKAIRNIDDQVKSYEEQKKQDKLVAIKGYWEACEKPFDIAFEKVLDQKWLNASVSLKSVYGAIDVLLEQITKDLSTLENLPEFSFEAIEVYKTTLNINSAISEGHRLSEIQKRKAEYEAEQERLKAEAEYNSLPKTEVFPEDAMNPPEVPTEEAHQWLGFKAYLTVTDAQALGNFMRCRGIQFEQIEIQ